MVARNALEVASAGVNLLVAAFTFAAIDQEISNLDSFITPRVFGADADADAGKERTAGTKVQGFSGNNTLCNVKRIFAIAQSGDGNVIAIVGFAFNLGATDVDR